MAVLPASFSLSTCAPSYPSTATMATLTSLLLFSCTLIAMAAPIDEELWVHNLHEPPSRRRTDLVYHIGMNSRRKNPAIWTKPGRSYWVLLSVCLPHLLPHPGQGVLTLSFPFILLALVVCAVIGTAVWVRIRRRKRQQSQTRRTTGYMRSSNADLARTQDEGKKSVTVSEDVIAVVSYASPRYS